MLCNEASDRSDRIISVGYKNLSIFRYYTPSTPTGILNTGPIPRNSTRRDSMDGIPSGGGGVAGYRGYSSRDLMIKSGLPDGGTFAPFSKCSRACLGIPAGGMTHRKEDLCAGGEIVGCLSRVIRQWRAGFPKDWSSERVWRVLDQDSSAITVPPSDIPLVFRWGGVNPGYVGVLRALFTSCRP
jgi:hypothetical protein